jgi:hypothetical protein
LQTGLDIKIAGQPVGQISRPSHSTRARKFEDFLLDLQARSGNRNFPTHPPVAERRFSCSLTWLPITPHPEFHGRAVPVLDDQAK